MNLIDVVALLGQRTHGLIGEHVVQAVVGQVVEDGDVAVLVARAAVHQQVRRLGHRFLAAGHHDVELAGPNQLVSQGDGVDTRQAHLVDRQRGDVPADACVDRGLPGRHLPGTRGQDLAHDHVLDREAGYAGLLQRALDGDGAQIRAREILQRTGRVFRSACVLQQRSPTSS